MMRRLLTDGKKRSTLFPYSRSSSRSGSAWCSQSYPHAAYVLQGHCTVFNTEGWWKLRRADLQREFEVTV